MSRRGIDRSRPVNALAFAAGLVLAGSALLTGCAGQGATGPGSSGAVPGGAESGSGPGAKPGSGSGTGSGSGSGSTVSYVLQTPQTAGGFAIHQATAANDQKILSELAQISEKAGISGTTVTAVYDDPSDDAWIVFAGINGQGFDPGKLAAMAQLQPVYQADGTGDDTNTSWLGEDAGPHGGSAACQETLVQSGPLAAQDGVCFWMTSTTFGLVAPVSKNDGQQWDFGWSATQVAGFMQRIRPDVEQS